MDRQRPRGGRLLSAQFAIRFQRRRAADRRQLFRPSCRALSGSAGLTQNKRTAAMKVHVVNVTRPDPAVAGHTLERIADLARQVESRGFAGLWVTDSFGRGRATLD